MPNAIWTTSCSVFGRRGFDGLTTAAGLSFFLFADKNSNLSAAIKIPGITRKISGYSLVMKQSSNSDDSIIRTSNAIRALKLLSINMTIPFCESHNVSMAKMNGHGVCGYEHKESALKQPEQFMYALELSRNKVYFWPCLFAAKLRCQNLQGT
jgi:hypothetical protein